MFLTSVDVITAFPLNQQIFRLPVFDKVIHAHGGLGETDYIAGVPVPFHKALCTFKYSIPAEGRVNPFFVDFQRRNGYTVNK